MSAVVQPGIQRGSLNGSNEFRRGGMIVAVSVVGITLGLSPIPFYEISLFAPPLAREFGWSVGSIMAGVLFMMCGSLIASPIAGILADRFGARRVALTSIVGFGLCLSLFSLQRGSLPLYYADWFFMALTGAGTLPITWTRTINQNFDAKKGLALGVALAGTGLSGFLLRPATGMVIDALGWRGGFLFLALLPMLIALPLTWRWFRQPSITNLSGERVSGYLRGISFGDAIRDQRFWLIGFGIVPVAFAVSGTIANLDSVLKNHGVDHAVVVRMGPLLGLAVIVGRVGGGWLVDRVWAPAVAFGLFTIVAAASWLMVNGPPTPSCVLVGVIGTGLAAGLEFDLMSFMTARYFGARSYGVIYGTLYAFFALGAGVAPLVYGRSFDATHSFVGIVSTGSAAMVLGGVLMLFLGRYRYLPE